MDDSIRKRIIGIRSKYCEPILDLLAQEGELYHGDLAEKLNISPSGLNVIIKKMQEGDSPIIEVMQISKYKIYTLPAAVKDYILSKHSEKNMMNRQGGISQVEIECENVFLCLQYFVDKAGDQWRAVLNLLLQGNKDDADYDIQKSFDILMKSIENSVKYRREEIEDLYKFLDNDVLVYLIQNYLDELAECELILEEIERRENGNKLVRHFRIK